jgi:hypothetical protein
MPTKITSLVLVILLLGAGTTQSQVSLTYTSAGTTYFSMAIPDNWLVNVGSDEDLTRETGDRIVPARLISAMPDDGVPLWFGMWVPEDLATNGGAKEYVASLGLDLLSDVVISEMTDDTLNSMQVRYVSGTGNKEGELMDFRAGIFQLAPEYVAIAIYIGSPETTTRHGEDLARMIQSLRSLIN